MNPHDKVVEGKTDDEIESIINFNGVTYNPMTTKPEMTDTELIEKCKEAIENILYKFAITPNEKTLLTKLISRFDQAQKENEQLKAELQNALEFLLLTKGSDKIELAKSIIAQIFSLYHYAENGHKPAGYGNWELNKATDAMYDYIKEMTPLPHPPKPTP